MKKLKRKYEYWSSQTGRIFLLTIYQNLILTKSHLMSFNLTSTFKLSQYSFFFFLNYHNTFSLQ